jgi:hypothetical protein
LITMTRIQTIQQAIAEAQRFIDKANKAVLRLKEIEKAPYGQAATKETGAVKRAALDLKQSLTAVNQMTAYNDSND